MGGEGGEVVVARLPAPAGPPSLAGCPALHWADSGPVCYLTQSQLE